jgi:hypothetical protein
MPLLRSSCPWKKKLGEGKGLGVKTLLLQSASSEFASRNHDPYFETNEELSQIA